ncbi:hypothetical protein ASC80_11210 [Afipia sp. Root123D2]|uniref:hypothetical protein n=1 Tax=Afipia sp. Root123D2 TaxID=1736436 RepID=UPI0006F518A6|nr:hypothetical protein [Afipia sp. Root123D2]KQW20764.1 hypothetical protein ASC80_11210 [Afipia sp. Root123D2]
MFARIAFGILIAGAITAPAFAEQMNANEARKFVANKLFAFNCFDGTKGVGRVYEDGSAAGSVQFSGSGQLRHMRLPHNTLQVRGQSICASIKGLPFEPCFNLDKSSPVSFRGAVSGLGFAYCDFHKQGNVRTLMTRMITRPRSLRAPHPTRSADASRAAEVHTEPALELRRSTTD